MKIKGILILLVGLLSLSSCKTSKEKLNLTYESIEENESYFNIDHKWTVTIGEDRYHYSYKKYKNNVIMVQYSLNNESTNFIFRYGEVRKTVVMDVVAESFFDMTEEDFLAQYTKESSFQYNVDFDQTKEFTSLLKTNLPLGSPTITSNFIFNDTYEYKIDLLNITETISNVSLRLTFDNEKKIDFVKLIGKNKSDIDVEVIIRISDFNIDYK